MLDKNRSKSWLAKKLLSIFTVLVLILLIVVYEYTYSDLKQKVENVKVSSISIESDDSLLMTNNGRKQLEDSLLLLKSQLSKLQNQLKKKSVLLGSNNQFHRDIQENINITDADIDKIVNILERVLKNSMSSALDEEGKNAFYQDFISIGAFINSYSQVNNIAIVPKDLDSRNKIIQILDQYNNSQAKEKHFIKSALQLFNFNNFFIFYFFFFRNSNF